MPSPASAAGKVNHNGKNMTQASSQQNTSPPEVLLTAVSDVFSLERFEYLIHTSHDEESARILFFITATGLLVRGAIKLSSILMIPQGYKSPVVHHGE